MIEGNNYKIDNVEFHLRLKKAYIWSKNVFETCIKILLGKRSYFEHIHYSSKTGLKLYYSWNCVQMPDSLHMDIFQNSTYYIWN